MSRPVYSEPECTFWLPHKNKCRALNGVCPGKKLCSFFQSEEVREERNARYGKSDVYDEDKCNKLSFLRITKRIENLREDKKNGKR